MYSLFIMLVIINTSIHNRTLIFHRKVKLSQTLITLRTIKSLPRSLKRNCSRPPFPRYLMNVENPQRKLYYNFSALKKLKTFQSRHWLRLDEENSANLLTRKIHQVCGMFAFCSRFLEASTMIFVCLALCKKPCKGVLLVTPFLGSCNSLASFSFM